MAIGAGWQSKVAYINIGSYYIIGVPLGVLLGYVAHLSVKVRSRSDGLAVVESTLHLISLRVSLVPSIYICHDGI